MAFKDYFIVDNNLCIISWDEKIQKVTGKSSSSVIGKKYYKVIPMILVGKEDAISVVLKTKKPLTVKDYYFYCLYDQVQANLKIVPMGKKMVNVDRIKIFIDLSSTCSAVRKLRDYQRLIDIGRVASIFAHGVRNPLNAIKGAVVYIRERYAKEKILLEFTDIMEDEIKRLDNFISRFLSSSSMKEEMTKTDINAIVRKAEVFTSLQVHTKNIIPVFKYGELSPVIINAYQIEQAILNIINNSIEAMPLGGQLTVRTQSENHSGIDFAVVEITDTGKGIAPNMSRYTTNPQKKKRRGFGLFLAREFLQYHGGNMEIKSKKGLGTTVRLSIPII